MVNQPYIPFHRPSFGDEEKREVIDTLTSGQVTAGPKTQVFEHDFAAFLGVEHALAVNCATAGLHLALDAAGVRPGDKVITSTYTFTASAEPIHYINATPVFVDADPETFNMDVDALHRALERESGVAAILPIHIAGQSCEMREILELAGAYRVKVVEDAAHALPTSYRGKLVGTLGDLTVFSFYATKTLATGEGGMVVTNDGSLVERIRLLRLHGKMQCADSGEPHQRLSWRYEIVEAGFKYNLTDIASALGIHQLKKCRAFWERRQWIAKQYNDAFADMPLRRPCLRRPEDMHSWHLYILRLNLEELRLTRDDFIREMYARGIETSVHFKPLHQHPYWRKRYGLKPEDFPVANSLANRVVSLPIYPAMSDADTCRVAEAVTGILKSNRR